MNKIVLIFIAAIFTGCSKNFLEKESLTQIANENFWKTESDFQLGVNAIYDALQDRPLYSGNLNAAAGLPMYDCFGDNLHNNYKWEGPGNYMIGIATPDQEMFRNMWTSLYKGIGRANTAIENIEKISVSIVPQDKKNIYLGQAKFLRALFYFNLAVYFSDVPLILKVQSLEDSYVPKNTYAEVSAQIIKDLEESIPLLPVSYPSTQFGYATRGAALGLLARFQLYNKNYQAVLDATNTLLTLGYSLNSNYAQLFTEQGELSREIVFSVRFNQDVSNNGELFSATFLGVPKIDQNPMPNMVNSYYCTDGRPITSSPLYNPANPKANRDPRCVASVYFRNDVFLTDLNRVFTGNTPTTYGLKKYVRTASVSPTGISAFSPGGQDFYVIRYADVLLMRAEALVELNQLGDVYNLVNQVRARVNMPTVQSVEGTGLTQAALRTIVRNERRVELAFEGLRYFDLKRWNEVEASFTRARNDNVSNYAVIFLPGKSEVFPIPLRELNINSKLIQHPAWQ
jgi:hypothetical protein